MGNAFFKCIFCSLTLITIYTLNLNALLLSRKETFFVSPTAARSSLNSNFLGRLHPPLERRMRQGRNVSPLNPFSTSALFNFQSETRSDQFFSPSFSLRVRREKKCFFFLNQYFNPLFCFSSAQRVKLAFVSFTPNLIRTLWLANLSRLLFFFS